MKKTWVSKRILIIIILLLIVCQTEIYAYEGIELASGIINPNDFNPGKFVNAFDDAENVMNMGATIISAIRVIGVIVTVISLILIGIKYMTASVEEKADYKKSMIPYLIGVFIFFSLSQIIPIIIDLSSMLGN